MTLGPKHLIVGVSKWVRDPGEATCSDEEEAGESDSNHREVGELDSNASTATNDRDKMTNDEKKSGNDPEESWEVEDESFKEEESFGTPTQVERHELHLIVV